MSNHFTRSKGEKVIYDFGDFHFADFRGALGVNKYRNGFSDADSVRELDFAGVGKFRGDDIFGDVSGHIACCPVDLCGVFSAKASTAVAAAATISINDDFSSCKSAVTVRAACYETASGVNVEYDIFAYESFGKDRHYNLFDDLFSQSSIWH